MVDHGEEVAGFEAAVEEGVEHVLGGEVEADGAVICGFEFREAGAEGGGGVGDILHDVGGEPDFADADFFVVGEDFEGALHGADAVVDAGENVAVPVGGAFEEAAVEDGVVFGEGPHSRLPFLGMQRYRLFRQSQRGGDHTNLPHPGMSWQPDDCLAAGSSPSSTNPMVSEENGTVTVFILHGFHGFCGQSRRHRYGCPQI